MHIMINMKVLTDKGIEVNKKYSEKYFGISGLCNIKIMNFIKVDT